MMNRKTFLKLLTGSAAAISLNPLAARGQGDPAPARTGLAEPPDTSNWARIRDLFPLTRERVYFNTGGLGPPSGPVLDVLREQTLDQAISGETGHGLFHRAHRTAADYLGAEEEEVCFTRNATEGNSIIAAGLDLRPDDEVIFESHAHPGGSFPWLVQQKENGIKVRIFEPDPNSPEGNLDRIFSMVNERTRVIQVSHLTAPTGILFDVAGIAREARRRGIWFHIDGAQSAGMIPVDLHRIGCDSYATSGHKWMNGPQETGILYIARERMAEVACSHAGAYSLSDYKLPDRMTYVPTTQRHEYGTRDAAPVAGLETAILLQNRIGRERIARHGKSLVDRTRSTLREIDGLEILTPDHPEMYNSIISFRLEGLVSDDIARMLTGDYHLRCRNVTERGLNAIRISWHVYNSEDDLELLASAVRSIQKQSRS